MATLTEYYTGWYDSLTRLRTAIEEGRAVPDAAAPHDALITDLIAAIDALQVGTASMAWLAGRPGVEPPRPIAEPPTADTSPATPTASPASRVSRMFAGARS